MPRELKRMDLDEFRALGLLQEVNRRFFHPLGLALEVIVEQGRTKSFGGVWDMRDDPEGIAFLDQDLEPELARRVDELLEEHRAGRLSLLGSVVQRIVGYDGAVELDMQRPARVTIDLHPEAVYALSAALQADGDTVDVRITFPKSAVRFTRPPERTPPEREGEP